MTSYLIVETAEYMVDADSPAQAMIVFLDDPLKHLSGITERTMYLDGPGDVVSPDEYKRVTFSPALVHEADYE